MAVKFVYPPFRLRQLPPLCCKFPFRFGFLLRAHSFTELFFAVSGTGNRHSHVGEYALFLDAEMAVEGEDPSAGGTETEVYRLNGLTALAAGASSSAIESAIGSFGGLLEAVRAGRVIIDAPDAANGERKTAVWAMASGSTLVGMDFHTAPDKVTRYAVMNAASGLTLTIRAYSLLTEDGTLNDLTTDAKTVPGAINELAEKASEGGGTMQWDTWN